MKKIILISFLISFLFSSCTDSFLQTVNKNTLDVSTFFQTENDLLLAVNAAYCPLAEYGMFGREYFLKFNTLDPYIWFENPKGGLDQLIINTSDFQGTWDHLYQGVFRTSDVLANMDRVKALLTDTKYAQYKGQLMALQGMYYFYLVTWFNTPIYYDETNVPTNPLLPFKNGTPEQFWNKIEDDLNYAAYNLPDSWPSTETGRITKGAANAQLGKALLYKHYMYYLRFGKGGTPEAIANLQKAKDAFKRVIDSNDYQLIQPQVRNNKLHYQAALLSNSSYLDIPVGSYTYKSENNLESIWEIQYNDDNRAATGYLPGWQWGGNLNYLYFSPNPASYRNQEIDPTFWDECKKGETTFPAGYSNDPRAYATCYLEGDTLDWRKETGFNIGFSPDINSKMIVQKNNLYSGISPSRALGLKKYNYPQFVGKSSPLSAPFNVRVIRYADVLLMYAETCYQIDKDADGSGLTALNQVRKRVDMPVISALTPAAIIHERTIELATEGHQYNDIVRWTYDTNFGIDLIKYFGGNFNINKNRYFPIPQSEIDVNTGSLKQNPGW